MPYNDNPASHKTLMGKLIADVVTGVSFLLPIFGTLFTFMVQKAVPFLASGEGSALALLLDTLFRSNVPSTDQAKLAALVPALNSDLTLVQSITTKSTTAEIDNVLQQVWNSFGLPVTLNSNATPYINLLSDITGLENQVAGGVAITLMQAFTMVDNLYQIWLQAKGQTFAAPLPMPTAP
jgi:hypothetical protein